MLLYLQLSALLNFLVSILLGSFVLLKSPRGKVNRWFFLWCFSVAVWAFFYYFWQIEDSKELALLWTRLLMLGAVWVPFTSLSVVTLFLNIKENKKNILNLNLGLAVLFSFLLVTPLMVSHIESVLEFRNWPKPGILY
ncbi:hypothetical protein HY622_02080, partial [Candidatus Uhrbacteria bacterium]|nr:hypothetical protein [Candidatus Uhrbacteria bacterium]